MALTLRDAGLDTVIFDGPGQGTALDAGMPMTPDWHLPVSAVLNHFELTDCTLMGFLSAAPLSCVRPPMRPASAV